MGKLVQLCGGIVLAVSLFPFSALAQERSYAYDSIDFNIVVNRDASIIVDEKQTYSFNGDYHLGYRAIPHKGLHTISDISVYDAQGMVLSYSARALDKDDPASWDKFTTYEENGSTIIEWYFDLKDKAHENRTWILEYKAHGALGFFPDHDELYWNLFTDYDVSVGTTTVRVHIPDPVTQSQLVMYTDAPHDYVSQWLDSSTAFFETSHFDPKAKVTIAVGWQKGVISQNAFWWDWMYLYRNIILSIGMILGSLLFKLLHWYFTEVYHKGRGTIIPEYVPPQSLPPAMAELVATEKISESTWPATLVDLAVRGYVRIIEEKRSPKSGIGFIDRWFTGTGYIVEKRTDAPDDSKLRPYEREFLGLLFEENGKTFSTIDFKDKMESDRAAGALFQKAMKDLADRLYEETTEQTKAYAVPLTVMASPGHRVIPSKNKYFVGLLQISGLVLVLLFLFGFFANTTADIVLVIFSAYASLLIVMYSTVYNPRLNREGFLLRDDWRGFKLYLETAEKYRLQNLTPDTFEKFLPYAMIFKIEATWAKAFDGMNLTQPQWYQSSSHSSVGGSSLSVAAFSASAFSTSFSSSFTSAFSSSGASGGAGGGGSAGGGGGGGGGGAR